MIAPAGRMAGVARIFRPRGHAGRRARSEDRQLPMQDTVRVGLIGSGFITSIHTEALRRVAGAEVVAVASPTPGRAERFAAERRIAHHFTDYRALLDLKEVDLVVLGIPNDLHCEVTCLAAEAGKHVVVEKPMALNLAECDRMIAACERAGVMLGYAEELCFAPKYVRLKQLIDEGALGKVHLVKQSEKHDGPHAELVLRHPPQRRRSDVRHGLPRDRVLPLAARRFVHWRQGADPERLRPDGHLRPRRQDQRRRRGDLALDVRRGRRRPGRGELDQAGRDGRPGRGLRQRGTGLCRRPLRQRPPRLLPARVTATPSRRPGPRRAGRFRSTRRSGTTASRRRWSTSSPASAREPNPARTATTAAPSSRPSMPSTPRPAEVGASSCRLPATRPGRSITGSRPAPPGAALRPQRPPASQRR